MSKKSKVAYRAGTQTTSNDMPKIQNTLQRKGVYYYNARNPQDLVDAGLVKSHWKKTLGMKNYSEAKRLAALETLAHATEIDSLRRKLLGAKSHVRSKERPPRLFSALSKRQQRTLILEYFVKLERKNEATANTFAESRNEKEKELILDGVLADSAVYEGGGAYRGFDWKKSFCEYFEKMGYDLDERCLDEEMLHFYRKATCESHRRLVERVRGRSYLVPDQSFSKYDLASVIDKVEATNAHTIEQLCERYPNRMAEGKLAQATILSYATPIRVLKDYFTPERSLESLGYEDAESLIDFLSRIPANANKKYPESSLTVAANEESKKANPALISACTQKNVFNTIKAMFKYANDIDWISKNPFVSPALRGSLPEVKSKQHQPYSDADLHSLFNSPKYVSIRQKKNKSGENREGYFWLPVIGLLSGARANEIASILVSDVKQENGIFYLNLSEMDDEGKKVKLMKTEVSRRRVPIHSEILKMGFLEYVDHRRRVAPKDFLFPDLKPNKKSGNRAKTFSQWFGRLRDEFVQKADPGFTKDFHGFRHMVTDQLRESSDSDELRYALLGWTEGNKKKNSGYKYGKGFSINKLRDLVEMIDPRVDLSHLYLCKTEAVRKRARK